MRRRADRRPDDRERAVSSRDVGMVPAGGEHILRSVGGIEDAAAANLGSASRDIRVERLPCSLDSRIVLIPEDVGCDLGLGIFQPVAGMK